MSSYLKLPSARRVVVSALVACALVAMAAVMACQFLISDSLPAGYTCRTGLPDETVCPNDQVCVPLAVGTEGNCVPKCHDDCPAGQVCDPKGWCVTVSDGGSVATDAQTSDVLDGQTPVPPDDSGLHCEGYACRCASTTDCPTGLVCVDRTAATPDIWAAWVDSGLTDSGAATGGVCLAPCCTSANDCDDFGGNVCFATGGGGSYCVPPAWLGDRGDIGMLAGGQPCGDSGACRSGLCTAAGYCADTCCSDNTTTECAQGASCRFGPFPGPNDSFDKHASARCMPTGTQGNGMNGQRCMANVDCHSNLCIDGGFNGGGGQQQAQVQCHDACRNPDDCPASGGGGGTQSCQYVAGVAGGPTELVAACMSLGGQQGGGTRGDAGGGAPCRVTNDCQRGYCVGGSCLAVCFANGGVDCNAQEHCRPQQLVLNGAAYSVLGCGM